MRHKNIHRKFGREAQHRMAMLRNAVSSLIEHERIIGAYIVLGNFDLMLHVVARSIGDYQEFYLANLSGLPFLGDINSMTVMATLKEARIPI